MSVDWFNIAEKLKELSVLQPEKEAIIAEDLTLNYFKLNLIVESYAGRLVGHGVRPGDRVTINTSDSIVSIVSVIALAAVDAIYVPFDPGIENIGNPKVKFCLHTEERGEFPGVINLLADASWSPNRSSIQTDQPKYNSGLSADTTVWIVPSSGTTGRQKYSSLSAVMLSRRIKAIAEDYSGQETRLLLLFRAGTRPHMIRAIAALASGHTLIDTRNANFAQSSGANIVCASPQQIVTWAPELVFDPKIPLLQVSGAKVEKQEIERMLQSFDVVEDVYGSNETIKSHVNVYTLESDGLNCVGKTSSLFVEIVGENGQPCQKGVAGKVRVKTPYMIDGYLNDPEATRSHFKSGWFYPGDLGRILKDNVLEILGRQSDVINVGGEKLLLSDIDQYILQTEGIVLASCFRNPVPNAASPLAACLVLEKGANARFAVESAYQNCVAKIGHFSAPRMFLVVDGLEQTQDSVVIRKKAVSTFVKMLIKSDPIELNYRLYKLKAEQNG